MLMIVLIYDEPFMMLYFDFHFPAIYILWPRTS